MLNTSITRRTALTAAAGLAAVVSENMAVAANDMPKTGMGMVVYNVALRRKLLAQQGAKGDISEPLTFLKHCQSLGAGGMQANLGVLSAERVKELRDYAAEHGLFIEGIINPPKDQADVARFEAEIKSAADVAALAVRTVVMPGRRYEQFKSLAEVRESEAKAKTMLTLAKPIVEKHRVKLAVENHKDQRIEERLELYQQVRSDYIGACVDTGNSFALLDDVYGAIEALAPLAFSVHLKDQALREYEQGFYLGDIPLGGGSFDLAKMVGILRKAKPDIKIQLELITRDPLKVTCLTDQFWAVLGKVPGSDLARTLNFVRQHPAKELQQVSGLTLAEQVALEDANLVESLRYAQQVLKL